MCGDGVLTLAAFDANTFPERDSALDFRGSRLGFRVIPGGVFVFHSIDFDMVVVGCAFPWANGCVHARLQDIFGDGVGRKILISLDDHGVAALGNDLANPNGFCHVDCSSCSIRGMGAEPIPSLSEDWMRGGWKRFA